MNPTALLSSCMAVCKAHPAAVTMIAGAFVSTFYNRLDKYPRMHAAFSLLAHAGVNLPGVANALVRLVAGKSSVAKAAPLALLAVVLLGCGGAPANTATRATARSAVAVAEQAWNLAADTCLAAADAGLANPYEVCGKPLDSAHDLIVSAAEAVDTNWSQGAACDLAEATGLIAKAATAFPSLAGNAVLLDANAAAQGLTQAACSGGDR